MRRVLVHVGVLAAWFAAIYVPCSCSLLYLAFAPPLDNKVEEYNRRKKFGLYTAFMLSTCTSLSPVIIISRFVGFKSLLKALKSWAEGAVKSIKKCVCGDASTS